MPKTQTFQNHIRYFPLFHFVLAPLLSINLIYQLVRLYQEPSWDRGMFSLLSLVFLMMIVAARTQALRAQDRVIRLEETIRYREKLPKNLAAEVENLRLGELIALRFASDAELPGLLARVQKGEFKSTKEIKQAITNWRGDHHRV